MRAGAHILTNTRTHERTRARALSLRDDWDTLTLNEKWTNKDGEVDVDIFETVMRHQLKMYVQRQVQFE